MSYCRFSRSSDVFLYPDKKGICCSGCSLSNGRNVHVSSSEDALTHLQKHKAAGDSIPEYAFSRLRGEIAAANATKSKHQPRAKK